MIAPVYARVYTLTEAARWLGLTRARVRAIVGHAPPLSFLDLLACVPVSRRSCDVEIGSGKRSTLTFRGSASIAPAVTIRPDTCGGAPCVPGHRIPVTCVSDRHDAGESVGSIAADYRLDIEAVRAALAWERGE